MNDISVNNSFSENNCCQKSEDLDKLVEMIKQKLVISSRTEKIKLLTLTPPSRTIEQTIKYFGVIKCMVKKARTLLKNKGLLCEPDQRTRKGISEELRRALKCFIRMMNYSRMCPGKKE